MLAFLTVRLRNRPRLRRPPPRAPFPQTSALRERSSAGSRGRQAANHCADRGLLLQVPAGLLTVDDLPRPAAGPFGQRSEEHTSELQSLMRISYAVFCLKKNKQQEPSTN